ncbi:hypothetical protein CBL_03433 [Carabus blaptoides fortunei]
MAPSLLLATIVRHSPYTCALVSWSQNNQNVETVDNVLFDTQNDDDSDNFGEPSAVILVSNIPIFLSLFVPDAHVLNPAPQTFSGKGCLSVTTEIITQVCHAITTDSGSRPHVRQQSQSLMDHEQWGDDVHRGGVMDGVRSAGRTSHTHRKRMNSMLENRF